MNIIGLPSLGDSTRSFGCIRYLASACASSDCGTCRFISSPSKSALYGHVTDTCIRIVLPGSILTVCAMIESLCSVGCLLISTMSPSTSCLSIM